ncbi:MAG: hypothetical protein WAO50_12200 [Candidatus Nanopelagicales bacterium]|nr:hypothetical protein [Candidatus Nanopelagicales bacterium]MCF8536766.1 hypothetical protein [Candidatus Nanopelagicales bacterium]MCF8542216.1 hypothetical protein [Candidatus Nanopelagicales bacterium]MCF8557566.1 hypothetical protein [Candidatus Nanopelagicales bacterium]MDA2986116.1 hypothetical protein [Actinomycetota bacterium]
MSEHSENKQASIGAIVMLLILSALVVLGIGAMNGGDTASALIPGALLFLFGLFTVFTLGKD